MHLLLMSRETQEIRQDPIEWPRGFKDVPYEDYNPSLHFCPQKDKERKLYQGAAIHPHYQKYKDKIHRLKAEATDAGRSGGLDTLDSLDSPQTKKSSCRMQFIYLRNLI